MTPSASLFVPVRGLRYHVRAWGPEDAPPLLLLHGWMDVSASFQFLVDALSPSWRILAPDWRGFGLTEWPQDGYWFADYVADLDALVDWASPKAPANVIGHSLGANVAMVYAGVKPARVNRIVALDGFGMPAEAPQRAPEKLAKWLDALGEPYGFAPYRDMAAVAARLQKNNPRLPRDKAEFLAAHWAELQADGTAQLRADPKHRLPFPTAFRVEEMYATWERITAPVLWVAAAQSHIAKWLSSNGDGAGEVARRFAFLRNARLETIADAGHMLHHDQPEAVARALEAFLVLA
jgi:pimeloyl-ACP methyl ester carboxylesterase